MVGVTSLLRFLPRLGRSWNPLNFATSDFVRIPAAQKIEEETIPDYVASRYYPVRLGETFQDRYQIVGKLGYGTTSTVWLARDLRSVAGDIPVKASLWLSDYVFTQWLPTCHTETIRQLRGHGRPIRQ